MSADSSGWILIDFPRNIKQAKILENKFTGFTANTDNEKGEPQINGKALVVAIRHKIKPFGQQPRYTMVLRVVKGSYKEGGENG